MKSLDRYLKLVFLAFIFPCYGQNYFVEKYREDLQVNKYYNKDKIALFSKSNNAYNFMALGYYINSNNLMFLSTNDENYLLDNLSVLKPILIDKGANNYMDDNWKMNVSKDNQNFKVNGQEHIVSEGYFFRYVGEFLDIIISKNLYYNFQNSIHEGLIYSFEKWKNRSIEKFGDYSFLYHQRLHIGANWAMVALYLQKYNRKETKDYKFFIDQFDLQLKKALQLKSKNGLKYYVWNSTYPDKFCVGLMKKKIYLPVVQDVSHGNHIVLYLLKARELGNPNWTAFNFEYLVNTFKLNVLKTNRISDRVDGTSEKLNTGWRISDGWMKLIYLDNSLFIIAKDNLEKYQSKIKNSSLESQFNAIYHDFTYN
ncbi:hypothetical protein HX089_14870 [Myroides odoratimimus]|uniref:hypothetical protein n=1 Tax=Myroides odoratimimus TaxID=76832 RepID=UPI0025792246|nr:hypothetical protein [Myroides odoratimimus]MDM1517658.1 hypothetical protein [Myroides odoratimimus]